MNNSGAAVTADQVRALRERTGAGIMECKRALQEAGGKMEEAVKLLRAKGARWADEKSVRETRQGLIGSYVHGGKIGVLVEINCETDFVARTDAFKNFVHEVCLQVASMSPRYVRREEVPPEELGAEIETLQEHLSGIDDEAAQSMQQSHLERFCRERVLLDQPYVKDAARSIRDLLHETVTSTRENIVIQRFVRYALGEEIKPIASSR